MSNLKNKKIPLRKCVVTNERLPKGELLRIVKNSLGEVFVDESGKANGKGAYIKKDLGVLERAIKNKSIERAVNASVSEEIYEEIRNIIK